jgi:hypothetical protein
VHPSPGTLLLGQTNAPPLARAQARLAVINAWVEKDDLRMEEEIVGVIPGRRVGKLSDVRKFSRRDLENVHATTATPMSPASGGTEPG